MKVLEAALIGNCYVVWLGGRVVRTLDLRSACRGFESWLLRCRVQSWASCKHTHAAVTKQYNLVPANGRWCLAAGKVTVGLASHWPCITDISGSPSTDSRQWTWRWAPVDVLLVEYGAVKLTLPWIPWLLLPYAMICHDICDSTRIFNFPASYFDICLSPFITKVLKHFSFACWVEFIEQHMLASW